MTRNRETRDRDENAPPWFFSARGLFWVSLAFIVYATSVPFDLAHSPDLHGADLFPFRRPSEAERAGFFDAFQNVLLFVPLGFFFLLSKSPRTRFSILRSCAVGFSVSLGVEALQTMSASRTPSTIDLLTNTLGTFVGAAASLVARAPRVVRLRAAVASLARAQPGLLTLCAFFGGTLVALLSPFIPTLDFGLFRAKVRLFIDHPMGEEPFGGLLFDALVFLGLGFVAAREASALARRWERSISFSLLVVVLASWAVALECAQFFVLHHGPSASDAIANALGVTMGLVLARLVPASIGNLAVLYAAVLPLVRALSPFQFRSPLQAWAEVGNDRFVPFFSLFSTLRMVTLANTIESALAYIPLGYVLFRLGRSIRVVWCLGVLWAIALEFAQLGIVGRTFDLTEGIIAGSGALFGAWGSQRLLAAAKNVE